MIPNVKSKELKAVLFITFAVVTYYTIRNYQLNIKLSKQKLEEYGKND